MALFFSIGVFSVPGLQSKLGDGPLHHEKARGCFFHPRAPLFHAGEPKLSPTTRPSAALRQPGFRKTAEEQAKQTQALHHELAASSRISRCHSAMRGEMNCIRALSCTKATRKLLQPRASNVENDLIWPLVLNPSRLRGGAGGSWREVFQDKNLPLAKKKRNNRWCLFDAPFEEP